MAKVQTFKVSTLPTTPESDAIYYLDSGNGQLRTFVTDDEGNYLEQDRGLQLTLSTISLYIAADAGSASAGDYIGNAGFVEAKAELAKYLFGGSAYGRIYFRPGTHQISGTLDIDHPQGDRIQLRGLNAPTAHDPDTLYTGDPVADLTAFKTAWPCHIECGTHGFYAVAGTKINLCYRLGLIYTGTGNRYGCYATANSNIVMDDCAFYGFYGSVLATNFSTIASSNYCYGLHSTSRDFQGTDTSFVDIYNSSAAKRCGSYFAGSNAILSSTRSTVKMGGYGSLKGSSAYPLSASTSAYISLTGRRATDVFKIETTSSRALYANYQCFAYLQDVEIVGNTSYAAEVRRMSHLYIRRVKTDPNATTDTRKTIRAFDMSFIYRSTVTDPNMIFSPVFGVEGNNNSLTA